MRFADIFFTQEYKNVVDNFREEFDKSMKLFELGVQLETFKGVVRLGEQLKLLVISDKIITIFLRSRREIKGDAAISDSSL